MAVVVPSEGELELLDKMIRDALSVNEDYILKLYQNNYTPADTATVSSFTEANFTNYAAKTLTRASWNAATLVGGKAQTSYGSSPQNWTCGTTGNTIYGYWMQGASSNKVLWVERFAVARTLAEGDVLNITPSFSLNSEN
jgi:hypothetical protein